MSALRGSLVTLEGEMSLGQLLCLIVLFGVLLSFVVALPGWVTMVFIGMLALAGLVSGVVVFRRGPLG